MIKLIALVALIAAPLSNCSSGSGQPDPPVNITAPVAAE